MILFQILRGNLNNKPPESHVLEILILGLVYQMRSEFLIELL